MTYATNKDADQPSLISVFVVRFLDSRIPILAKSKISSLSLVSVAEQAGLSLTWSETPKTDFHVTWLINPLVKCVGQCRHLQVDKMAMIRNRYNQIPHPALNTKQERDTYN